MHSQCALAATAFAALLVLAGCAAKPGEVERVPTKLEICGERTIVDPSDEDIRSALGGLDAGSGDAFVILVPAEMTYIQASGDRRRGFDMEYQEGSIDRHFRATNESILVDDVAEAFIAYRSGDESWKSRFEFKRVEW